jgi:flavin-dependent dehydrogenase
VRRFEFDHQLLAAARRAGVRVSEGERVQRLSIEAGEVRVATDAGEHRARVVIGADGAKSVVRSSLVGPPLGRQMVALETVTGGYDDDEANTAVFDFRPVARGLRGYAWSFPSLRGEERWRVRGIGGSSWSTGTSLKTFFAESLAAQGVDLREYRYAGWSAPAYDPESPQSAPHALLAGDAVGVEPWLGEGITSAIGSGILAAHVAAEALVSGRFDFSDYGERLRESAVGWRMLRNRDLADPFYEAVGKHGLDFIVPGGTS